MVVINLASWHLSCIQCAKTTTYYNFETNVCKWETDNDTVSDLLSFYRLTYL